jgi:hypothetical protein
MCAVRGDRQTPRAFPSHCHECAGHQLRMNRRRGPHFQFRGIGSKEGRFGQREMELAYTYTPADLMLNQLADDARAAACITVTEYIAPLRC